MLDEYVPVAIVGIVFYSVFMMVRLFLEHRVRSRLIERGLVDENVKYLYAVQADSSRGSSLKWGIILVSIGSAFFIGELFPRYISREMEIAFMFLFSGIGLLFYYWFGPKKPVPPFSNSPTHPGV